MKNIAETWKDIPGYEGFYQVSDLGRIRSLDRVTKFKDGRTRFFKGKILVQGIGTTKYFIIVIKHNRVRKTFKAHRIVAAAFLPNPDNYPCVNHKDGDKLNNNVTNLEWCTYSENELHSINVLGKKIVGRPGKLNVRSIPVFAIDKCGNRQFYESQNIAAQSCNCFTSNVNKVLKGLLSQTNGYRFEYADPKHYVNYSIKKVA